MPLPKCYAPFERAGRSAPDGWMKRSLWGKIAGPHPRRAASPDYSTRHRALSTTVPGASSGLGPFFSKWHRRAAVFIAQDAVHFQVFVPAPLLGVSPQATFVAHADLLHHPAR